MQAFRPSGEPAFPLFPPDRVFGIFRHPHPQLGFLGILPRFSLFRRSTRLFLRPRCFMEAGAPRFTHRHAAGRIPGRDPHGPLLGRPQYRIRRRGCFRPAHRNNERVFARPFRGLAIQKPLLLLEYGAQDQGRVRSAGRNPKRRSQAGVRRLGSEGISSWACMCAGRITEAPSSSSLYPSFWNG